MEKDRCKEVNESTVYLYAGSCSDVVLLCCCVVAAVGDVTSAAADSSLLSRWQEVLKAGGRARGGERGRTEE